MLLVLSDTCIITSQRKHAMYLPGRDKDNSEKEEAQEDRQCDNRIGVPVKTIIRR
jgi:hypothetical protein